MIWEAEIAQFESEADEVDEEVWCMNAAVDKDGAVNVRV
jgi:hypothetical protein